MNRMIGYLALILLFLSGCSTIPLGGNAPADSSASSEAAQATTAPETAPPALQPNPYLQSKTRVSKQTLKQFDQALELMRQQHWQEARPVLLGLTATEPKLSGPWANLGIVYRELGEQDQALEAFAQAITLNPDNYDAYSQLAVLHRQRGEFEQAEAYYQDILERWADHQGAHKGLGILYDLYMGKLELALPHYERAYEISQITGQEDRALKGWVADSRRRLKQQLTEG